MIQFPVAERFVSINGEGTHAGQLATFIRFTHCNLSCSYCDTRWACTANSPHEMYSIEELCDFVRSNATLCVTLTGGEPLLQPHLAALVEALMDIDELFVEIETNGSQDLANLVSLRSKLAKSQPTSMLSFTVDYKLPSSGMTRLMHEENYDLLDTRDTVKYVCGSHADLEEAHRHLTKHNLCNRCTVLFSPVFGKLTPAEIVDFMREKQLFRARMQLQLHKIIWPNEDKGV